MSEGKEVSLPNYLVLEALFQSLRQLLLELIKVSDPKDQNHYLSRVFQWFQK